jgi:hypothetical protein
LNLSGSVSSKNCRGVWTSIFSAHCFSAILGS